MSDASETSIDKQYPEIEKLLELDGPVMLIGQQKLKPTSINPDDKKDIIFPPSYAGSEDEDESGDSVYNIDPPYDPKDPATHKNVCVLDSIPSQANRMEPLFKDGALSSLVPQYEIKFPGETGCVNILDIGHRIADSAFRGTELRAKIVEAFNRYKKHRDARGIAKLGPTSLVFGVWDSRGTGVKIPRLVNSIVRAFEVVPLRRSAQYSPPINYNREGLLPEGLTVKPTKYGLAPVPAPLKVGGVQVIGEIRRDFSLNLELLRDLRATLTDEEKKAISEKYKVEHPDESEKATTTGIADATRTAQREADLTLQRYLLGLALLAFTATQRSTLRQGCQLIQDGEPTWKTFTAKGDSQSWKPPEKLIDFADRAATNFVVVPGVELEFRSERLKASIDSDAAKKPASAAAAAVDVDPVGTLRGLVEALDFKGGDRFKAPAKKKLEDRITEIDNLSGDPNNLKLLASRIRPLLTDAPGAAERKNQMLALFPSASNNPAADTTSSDSTDQSTGGRE